MTAAANGRPVRIHLRTAKVLTKIICGGVVDGREQALSPYRSGQALYQFLAELGLTEADALARSSRHPWTEAWITLHNGTPDLRRIIEAAVRPADYTQTPFNVENAVQYLNEFLQHDDLRLVASGKRYVLTETTGVALAPPEATTEILSDAYIRELAAKCDTRIAEGDFDGAITVARTVIEAILGELQQRLAGERNDFAGDLPRQFKHAAKLLRMDADRQDLDDRFRDVIRGLVMVVNGLAPLRNKMSDGHARSRVPAPHHARVVVNAAKTIASFLVESYVFQRDRGDLPTPKEGGDQ